MNRIKRLFITTVIMLIAIGAFNLNAAKAVRYFAVSDTFTYNPASRWHCENVYFNYCIFDTHYGHNDYNSAWLGISGYASSAGDWIAVGRDVTLTPPAGTRIQSCTVRFYLQNSVSYHYGSGNAAVTGVIDVINPTNWSYIHTWPFFIDRLNLSWNSVTTGSFTPPATFYVRVSINKVSGDSRELAIDDMLVLCPLI